MTEDIKQIKSASEITGTVKAPPSKAETLRGLFLGALAQGETILNQPLLARDQKHCRNVLQSFGAEIRVQNDQYVIQGTSGHLQAPDQQVYTGKSGVTTRFAVPVATLAKGETEITGNRQIQKRPIRNLLKATRSLGGDIATAKEGNYPLTVQGPSLTGGQAEVQATRSSQFVSALLLASPFAEKPVELHMKGPLPSKNYIDITVDMMARFGVDLERDGYEKFYVPVSSRYRGSSFTISGDYSSASYFFAAAAITGGEVTIQNLSPLTNQPDVQFLEILDRMGCRVFRSDTQVTVSGKAQRPIEVDMNNCPDIVPTLAVVASCVDGETMIQNVTHLKYKESDRLHVLTENLGSCGITCEHRDDGLLIHGGSPEGTTIETYGDHRIAMAFSVLGLVADGMCIQNPQVVNKSVPDFYQRLHQFY